MNREELLVAIDAAHQKDAENPPAPYWLGLLHEASKMLKTEGEVYDENQNLRQDLDEMQATFDLRWRADMRAIKRWQAEKPKERELLWPDHVDLVLWLADQVEIVKAATTVATRKITLAAIALLQEDPHQWSSRPCPTCRAVTTLLGQPFGCEVK